MTFETLVWVIVGVLSLIVITGMAVWSFGGDGDDHHSVNDVGPAGE